MMLDLIYRAGSLTGLISTVIAQPIQLALERWSRRAELSADRAGFLGSQEPEAVLSALMKLSGGTIMNRFGQPDFLAFLKQSQRYHEVTAHGLDKVYSWRVNTESNHPQPVARAKEILEWIASEEYIALRQLRATEA